MVLARRGDLLAMLQDEIEKTGGKRPFAIAADVTDRKEILGMTFTARVFLIDPRTATGEIKRYFAAVAKASGRVPNSKRAWAHLPYIAMFQHLTGMVLHHEGAGSVLSCGIKQMAVLKTSHVNGCAY